MPDPSRRAAAAVRRVGDAMVAHAASDADLAALAAELERWADRLAAGPPRVRTAADMVDDMRRDPPEDGEGIQHFDRCPVCGPAHPFSHGLQVQRDGEEVVGRVVLGAACGGAPGRAHGGVVAALFDDVTAYLARVQQMTCYATDLRVRFRRAMPVGEPIELRARVVGRDGPRIMTEAEATCDGVVVATATCTKVEVQID